MTLLRGVTTCRHPLWYEYLGAGGGIVGKGGFHDGDTTLCRKYWIVAVSMRLSFSTQQVVLLVGADDVELPVSQHFANHAAGGVLF